MMTKAKIKYFQNHVLILSVFILQIQVNITLMQLQCTSCRTARMNLVTTFKTLERFWSEQQIPSQNDKQTTAKAIGRIVGYVFNVILQRPSIGVKKCQ